MRDCRGLKVWREAHEMTLSIYHATSRFPKEECYGLTSQIRRASASIGANLAEGCGRDSSADFGRFVQIAIGSANELDYHLLLAADLGFLQQKEFDQLMTKLVTVRKMLIGLRQSAKSQIGKPQSANSVFAAGHKPATY